MQSETTLWLGLLVVVAVVTALVIYQNRKEKEAAPLEIKKAEDPVPQPTESEAIVKAEKGADDESAKPVSLPVDKP